MLFYDVCYAIFKMADADIENKCQYKRQLGKNERDLERELFGFVLPVVESGKLCKII